MTTTINGIYLSTLLVAAGCLGACSAGGGPSTSGGSEAERKNAQALTTCDDDTDCGVDEACIKSDPSTDGCPLLTSGVCRLGCRNDNGCGEGEFCDNSEYDCYDLHYPSPNEWLACYPIEYDSGCGDYALNSHNGLCFTACASDKECAVAAHCYSPSYDFMTSYCVPD